MPPAPCPQSFVALGTVCEGGGKDRKRRGEANRSAQPLEGGSRDQLPRVRREPARERGQREEDEAEEQDAAATEQVGETAAEQEEATEGEDVGVDDPGQARLGEVERRADRRQRHVDDRRVED